MTVDEIINEIEALSDEDKATLNAKLIKSTVDKIKETGWKKWLIRVLCVVVGALSAWFTSGCTATMAQTKADGTTTSGTVTIILPEHCK